jgi:lipopolysaccharide/colanic/teichoic acid biosynthesis glycosyltransferase
LLVPALPLMLAAMALVCLTSRGWPIYTQTRLGVGGRRYKIYKIRSMYQDCERLTGARWSTPNDPRVTPVGRFLRLTHIDELPQLLNVLRGEMSLVGPRPERPELATQIEKALPCYRERLAVRPGVTGLAQVQLPPDIDLEGVRRKLACDLYYIQKVSFWLDLRIVIATALGVFGTPFHVNRALLRIPAVDVVTAAFRDQSGEMDTIPLGVEPLTHANPA